MANLSQQIQGFAFYNCQVFFAAFNLPKYANLKKGIWKLYRLQAIRSIRLSLLSITKKTRSIHNNFKSSCVIPLLCVIIMTSY